MNPNSLAHKLSNYPFSSRSSHDMGLSVKAVSLYFRYKANSSDLFQNPKRTDLSNFHQWTSEAISEHKEWLAKGYLRNCICLGARKKFRDQHVPVEKQDRGHEEAIRSAERNCSFYASEYRRFQRASRRAQQRRELEMAMREPDDGSTDETADETAEKEGQGGWFHGLEEAEGEGDIDPEEDADDVALLAAWEASQKVKAEMETDMDRAVSEVYNVALEHFKSLNVREEETFAVMQNLLSALAPSSSANRTWQDVDAQLVISQKAKEMTGEDIRSLLVESVVKHRKMVGKLTTVDRMGYTVPVARDAKTRKQWDIALLLQLIEESQAGSVAGTNGWQLNHFVSLRECAIAFRETGKLPERLPFSKTLPDDFLGSSGKAGIGMMVSGGRPPVFLPGRVSVEKEFRRVLASFKPIWKSLHIGTPEPEATVVLVLRVFMRCVEGTVDLPDVLIHPARFLYSHAAMPTVEAVVCVGQMLTVGIAKLDRPMFARLLSEVYSIVRTARQLLDIQYYHYYETYRETGKMLKELAERNPFDEDGNLVKLCTMYEQTKEKMKEKRVCLAGDKTGRRPEMPRKPILLHFVGENDPAHPSAGV